MQLVDKLLLKPLIAMYTHILTLIGPPQQERLSAGTIDLARDILNSQTDIKWLAAEEACDLAFALKANPATGKFDGLTKLRANIADLCEQKELDFHIHDLRGPRKMKLLISDMDSTMIEQECIDELADMAGFGEIVSTITERAMRGELDFEEALRERVGLLKGLDIEVLGQVYEERIKLMPGARELVQTMRANGAYCVLVSGGFTYFTARIADDLGFHENRANILESENDKLSGHVSEPILGRAAKLETLEEIIKSRGLFRDKTMAVGDGANDLAMIQASGLGVAYRAKPIVARDARAAVNYGDLTAPLYFQGYKRDAFIS
ncbi:MAG: phosphoserine phosphatase SerB [Methyloligellaceae bacterium]